MRGIAAACLLIGAASLACAGEVAFRRLCGGDDAVYGMRIAAAGPELALARDGDELRRVWAENVAGSYQGAGGMPSVDWGRDFVVAVFLGSRPSAGFAVRVEGVAVKGKVLEVRAAESSPKAAPSPRPASPYAMAACLREGVPLAEILMLRLVDGAGAVLAERPAWSYRMMDAGREGAPPGASR